MSHDFCDFWRLKTVKYVNIQILRVKNSHDVFSFAINVQSNNINYVSTITSFAFAKPKKGFRFKTLRMISYHFQSLYAKPI